MKHWTPLHHASNNGHSEAIRKLVSLGANIEAATADRDFFDREANREFNLAHYDPNSFAINEMENSAFFNFGLRPLHLAAYRGHAKAVEVLLQLGADKESNDEIQAKPLHKAAFKGYIEVMEILLESGAKAECIDEDKVTPLMFAAEHNQPKAIQCLVKYGGNVNAIGDNNYNAIHAAALHGNFECMKVLIELGAKHDGLLKVLRSDTEKVLQNISKFLDLNIENIETFIGEYYESLISKRVNNLPLLEYVNRLGLLRERELIIEIVQKLHRRLNGIALNAKDESGVVEKSVIKHLKCASKSSPGLTETLKSANEKFSWGTTRVIGMSLLCIILTLIGIFTYFLDTYTKANFAFTMWNSTQEDRFSEVELRNCTREFDRLMEEAIGHCQSNSNCFGSQPKSQGQILLEAFSTADRKGRDCFNVGDRFGDENINWIVAAIVTLVHMILPLLTSGIFWIILMIKKEQFSFWSLPLPPVTSIYQSYHSILLYMNERSNKLKLKWSDKKMMFIKPYQIRREKLLKIMDVNASLLIMSIMFGSALNATFQES